MGMDDYWKLSEVPGLAKTPSYFNHEKYGVMFHAVSEIRGNFVAHELLNHVMAHKCMHILLNKTLSLSLGPDQLMDSESREAVDLKFPLRESCRHIAEIAELRTKIDQLQAELATTKETNKTLEWVEQAVERTVIGSPRIWLNTFTRLWECDYADKRYSASTLIGALAAAMKGKQP